MVSQDLIESLKQGDQRSLKKIFDKLSGELYSYAYKFIKSREEADDITQEVFIRLWQTRHTLDPEKSLRSYLFTIARNHIIDLFRKKKSLEKLKKGAERETIFSANSTEEQVIFHELDALLRKIVHHLPEKQRDIFILSRYNGMSNPSIADKLQISVHTVDNQIQKALKTIRRFYLKLSTILIFVLIS